MHEMSLAQSILSVLEKNFQDDIPGRPERIKVRAGVLVQVNPVILSEAFAIISESSRWRTAALDVAEESPRVVCAECGGETEFPACVCANCKSTTLSLEGGDDLTVEEVTFDEQG